MDDFAAGAQNENGAITTYYELTALMNGINFHLAKWASNSEQLKNIWKAQDQHTEVQTSFRRKLEQRKWLLLFDPEGIIRKLPEGPNTKRQLLQTTSFYDPGDSDATGMAPRARQVKCGDPDQKE
jgi:hypothetical protein